MIYHALVIVNHVPYGLMIETEADHPHKTVCERATLVLQVHDYTKLKVWGDPGDLFAHKRHLGAYPERELVKWFVHGASIFAWQRFLERKPLYVERKPVFERTPDGADSPSS